jgi:hypothetical protein
MRKLLFLTFISINLFALNWNSVAGLFKKTINTLEYTIETSGVNPRVYEFDTQGYPRMHCVVVFRDNTKTSPAMQCVKVTQEEIEKNKKLMK